MYFVLLENTHTHIRSVPKQRTVRTNSRLLAETDDPEYFPTEREKKADGKKKKKKTCKPAGPEKSEEKDDDGSDRKRKLSRKMENLALQSPQKRSKSTKSEAEKKAEKTYNNRLHRISRKKYPNFQDGYEMCKECTHGPAAQFCHSHRYVTATMFLEVERKRGADVGPEYDLKFAEIRQTYKVAIQIDREMRTSFYGLPCGFTLTVLVPQAREQSS